MRRIILFSIIIFLVIMCVYPFRAHASSFSVTPGTLIFDHVAPDVTYTATLHVYGVEKSKGDSLSVSIDNMVIRDWISTEIGENTDAGLDVAIKLKVRKTVEEGTYDAHIILVKRAGELSGVVKHNTVEQINQITLQITVSSQQEARFKLNEINYAGAFRNNENQHVVLSFNADIQNIGGTASSPSSAQLHLTDHATGQVIGTFLFNEFKKIKSQDEWSGVLEFDIPRAFGLYDADISVYDAQSVIHQGSTNVRFDIPFDIPTKTHRSRNVSFVWWIVGGFVSLISISCVYFAYKHSRKHLQYEKK